jgi:hypothetical protein
MSVHVGRGTSNPVKVAQMGSKDPISLQDCTSVENLYIAAFSFEGKNVNGVFVRALPLGVAGRI